MFYVWGKGVKESNKMCFLCMVILILPCCKGNCIEQIEVTHVYSIP